MLSSSTETGKRRLPVDADRVNILSGLLSDVQAHLVPSASTDVRVHPEFSDSVRAVLDRWYTPVWWESLEDLQASLLHEPALPPRHPLTTEDGYFTVAEPDEATRDLALTRELQRLHRGRATPLRPEDALRATWVHRASQRADSIFPALMHYTGTEAPVKQLARKAVQQSLGGIADPRGPVMLLNMLQALRPVIDSARCFAEYTQYVAAYRCHKRYINESKRVSNLLVCPDDENELKALLRPVPTPDEPDAPTAATTETQRNALDGLVALVCSRLVKTHLLHRIAKARFAVDTQVVWKWQQRMQATEVNDISEPLRAEFEARLYREGWTVHDDSDASIRQLAQVAQCTASDVWRQVESRFQLPLYQFRRDVLLVCVQQVSHRWRSAVDHAYYIALRERLDAMPKALCARLEEAYLPAFAATPLTDAQRDFRRRDSTLTWWHGTAGRMLACGCDVDQIHFMRCMLRDMFIHLMKCPRDE